MSEKLSFQTQLSKVSNNYFPMIQRQLEENSINMDDYAKQCVMNSISAINETLDTAGVAWNDKQLDQNNITEILISIATLKLNPTASPNEVYFQLRNTKRKEYGQDVWKKQIEMGIEGDGNDAILARFGRNVKQVMKFWEVRENDKFEYPMFNGLEMTSPKWQPTGKGKVVKVVYPIIKDGDIVEYYIAEREDVVRNLIAHVNNNLMNQTFGIAKNRYEATADQRAKINNKKQEVLNRIDELGLDKSLDDTELQKYISPAWKSLQSRESMIIRKMRNNVVKKIPKDFGNTLAELSYDKTSMDVREEKSNMEIVENANSEELDFKEVEDEKQDEPKPEPQEDKSEEDNSQPSEKTTEPEEQPETLELSEDDVPF